MNKTTAFEGKIYDIGNTIEWLKSSIDMALESEEERDLIIEHMRAKLREFGV